MEGNGDKSALPRISDEDLAIVLFEEIIDPSHQARFDHLSQTNPKLIREIVSRAYVEAYTALGYTEHPLIPTLDLQKIIIDNVTFALSALELSIERQNTSGAAGDVSPPHLSEPGGDQPTV